MSSVSIALTIAGGIFEAGGLFFTVREIVRVEDRALPEKRNRLSRALRKLERLGRDPEPKTLTREVNDRINLPDVAEATVTRAPADPDDLPARVARLEQVVDDRDREHRGLIRQVEDRVVGVQQAHDREVAAVLRALDHEQAEEHEQLRDSLVQQWFGVGLFFVGVVLTTVGGVLT